MWIASSTKQLRVNANEKYHLCCASNHFRKLWFRIYVGSSRLADTMVRSALNFKK